MTGRSRGSALSTLRLIVNTEGVRGLFRGNGASCLRIVPYAAIHFSVYEAYRRILVENFTPPPPPPPPAAAAAAVQDAAASVLGGTGVGDGGGGGGRCSLRPAATSTSGGHLGEGVPPTPMTCSIEVSATAVITTVEEGQREEALEPPAAATDTATTEAAPGASAPAPAPAQGHDGGGQRQHRRRPRPVLDLVAGSAAGATAVLMTYPLDMVRTRLAWAMDGTSRRLPAGAGGGGVTASAPPQAHQTRIVPMLVHTARHEGVLGLYRGLAPTLYGIMPYAGLKFFVYSSLKQWYREVIAPSEGSVAAAGREASGGGGGERLPVPYMLAFGGTSGLLAQTVTYPLDVVRRRMQVHGLQQEAVTAAAAAAAVAAPPAAAAVGAAAEAPATAAADVGTRQRLSTWGVGSAILRQDGLRGLFRGLSLNYVKVVPSTAIGFTVYDMFKSYLGVIGNI